jgi:hypothetical protein
MSLVNWRSKQCALVKKPKQTQCTMQTNGATIPVINYNYTYITGGSNQIMADSVSIQGGNNTVSGGEEPPQGPNLYFTIVNSTGLPLNVSEFSPSHIIDTGNAFTLTSSNHSYKPDFSNYAMDGVIAYNSNTNLLSVGLLPPSYKVTVVISTTTETKVRYGPSTLPYNSTINIGDKNTIDKTGNVINYITITYSI